MSLFVMIVFGKTTLFLCMRAFSSFSALSVGAILRDVAVPCDYRQTTLSEDPASIHHIDEELGAARGGIPLARLFLGGASDGVLGSACSIVRGP